MSKNDLIQNFIESQENVVCDVHIDPGIPETVTNPMRQNVAQDHYHTPHIPETSTIQMRQNVVPDERLNPKIPESVTDLTKFIIKKDLMLSRLYQFDDHPERYCSWKISFQNIVKELEVTVTEEIDLLLRWLGPESRKQASSIKMSNAHENWSR